MIDLTGKKFGKLTVMRPNGLKYHSKAWLCKCDCGNDYTATTTPLTRGKSLSCGCGRKGCRSFNRYDLSGEYGICYFDNDNGYFLFDKEDYDKIENIKWYREKNGYVKSAKGIWVHRLIVGLPQDKDVDHINHNTLDNRKQNLRVCTHQENLMNSKTQKNNTSGHKGVFFLKKQNRYRAKISVNGKSVYLGTFKTFEEAVSARKKGERNYYGDFAFK